MNRDAIEWIGGAVSAALRERFTLFVSQSQSELGVEPHIAAVIRRCACGEPGAVLMDGKYLLTIEAHVEEIEIAKRNNKRGPGEGGVHAG